MRRVDLVELKFVQLLDSALPVGGFAHSFGLETWVAQGRIRTAEDLRGYLECLLSQAVAPMDGWVIRQVYAGKEQSEARVVWEADEVYYASRLAGEVREASVRMGRRLLHLVQALYGWPVVQDLARWIGDGKCRGTHPVVFAWICHALPVSVEKAIGGYLYTTMVNQLQAALRLMKLGQTEAQQLLNELLPVVIQETRKKNGERDVFCYTNFVAHDIFSMNHEHLYTRLFVS